MGLTCTYLEENYEAVRDLTVGFFKVLPGKQRQAFVEQITEKVS